MFKTISLNESRSVFWKSIVERSNSDEFQESFMKAKRKIENEAFGKG